MFWFDFNIIKSRRLCLFCMSRKYRVYKMIVMVM